MQKLKNDKELFLGIDSSTQGCKLTVIDVTGKDLVYVDSVSYDTDLPAYNTLNGVIQSPQKELSEADPQMWIDAMHLLFARMKKILRLAQIKAISVSAQQHGLVTLDAEGNLTRQRSKLWNDYSTAEECEVLTEKLGGSENMIREIGNTQRAGYTAGKIYHMYRHEPEAAAKTTTFFLVHNYVNWFLSGGKRGGVRVMEPGDTSGMALGFPGKTEWSSGVCNIISQDLISKLPAVKPSDQIISPISQELVERYGFDPKCCIDAGSGDNMYGAVGTGNIIPGVVTISLGTSGTAYTVLEEPYVDPLGEIASFADSTGKFLPLLCVSNMANGYNQFLQDNNMDHTQFNEMLKKTKPGNDGRLLFPWYMGERTPDLPEAKPLYWGFSLHDFSQEVLARAVLEGHILNLYDGFRRLPVEANEIRLTGGLSQSGAWCQTIADVFNRETVPIEGEGAALGAAIHAAWVYYKQADKGFSLRSLTDIFVKVNENRRKIPQNADAYARLKDVYHEISRRIRTKAGDIDPFTAT